MEFDDVYEEYNALQRKQGFDLRKYRAHTVKRYTYELSGDTPVPLNAELLVENGAIIRLLRACRRNSRAGSAAESASSKRKQRA